jgi:hypothetical protein
MELYFEPQTVQSFLVVAVAIVAMVLNERKKK